MTDPDPVLTSVVESDEVPMTDAERASMLQESAAWKESMDAARKINLFEEEGDHARVMDLGKNPESLANILKEFTREQFRFGGATMNRYDPATGETLHYTIRVWGRKLKACRTCQRVRHMTWALSDEGWIEHCAGGCGIVITPLQDRDKMIMTALAEQRRIGRQ